MIDLNQFGQFLDEEDAHQARASAITAPDVSPDDMATAMQIGNKRGIPAGVVAANLPDYHEQEHLDGVTAASQRSPAAARWFQTPEHAALSKGEPDKIGGLAQMLADAANPTTWIDGLNAIRRGIARGRAGESFVQGDIAQFANTDQALADALDMPSQGVRGILNALPITHNGKRIGEQFDPLGTQAESEGAARISAAVRSAQDDTATTVGGRPTIADFKADPLAAIEQTAAHYTNMGAASAPGMLMVATGNPEIAAPAMALPQGTQSYSDLVSQGVPKWKAAGAGVATGTAELLGEEFGLGKLLRGDSTFGGIATEALQEGVTQEMQDRAEGFASGQEMSTAQHLSNDFDASALGGLFGAAARTLHVAAGTGPQGDEARSTAIKFNTLGNLASSVDGAQKVSDIVSQVGDMKLGQRSPDALHALAKEAAPDAHVYLAADAARTLFQSDRASADQFVGDLTGNPDALREAEATGGDLVIPMADFVAKVATLPNAADIAEHARLHPAHLSRSELNNPDVVNEHIAAIFGATGNEKAAPDEGKPDSSEQIKQDVLGMLLATDRYKPADAEIMATLASRIFTHATRGAEDPMALYQRRNLRINGQGGANTIRPNTLDPRTDALITAARTDTIPSSREANGPTLVDLAQAHGINEDAMTGESRRLADSDAARKQAMRQQGRIRDYQPIVRPDGIPLDMLREAAVEAGYLPEGADINDLLDALDREMVTDHPVHSEANRNARVSSFREDALGFQQAIAEKFGDQPIDHLSNQDLHDALFPAERSLLQKAGDKIKSLFQSKPVAAATSPGVESAHAEQQLKSRVEQWHSALDPDAIGGYRFDRGESAARWADSDAQVGRGGSDGALTSRERKTAAGHRLIEAANSGGFFMDDALTSAIEQSAWSRTEGAEHDVHFVGDGDGKLAIRSTANGNFGPMADITPEQYLQRLREFNQVFPDTQMQVLGVSKDADGNAVIWSAQRFVEGEEFATQAELAHAMAAHGWKQDGEGAPRFIHEATGAVIEDAHTGNILHIGDDLFPIDVIVEKMPAGRTLNQPAFHGSPHRFEKFSLQHIGSGEGAQAYGWGMYFASEKDIAEHYRKGLAGSDSFAPKVRNEVTDTVSNYLTDGRTLDEAKREARARITRDLARAKGYGATDDAGLNQYIANVEANLPSLDELTLDDFDRKHAGQLYAVDVPDDHDLLDWDKPLSEQPENVKDALERAGIYPQWREQEALQQRIDKIDLSTDAGQGEWRRLSDEMAQLRGDKGIGPKASGRSAYHSIGMAEATRNGNPFEGEDFNPSRLSSEALNAAGIPGLRYLDGSSRNHGEGSHNYVIWDENAIGDPSTFYQPDGSGGQSPRGQLRIGPDGSLSIDLLKGADLSTFVHELGHVALELMQDAAESSPEIKADLDLLRKAVGNDGGAFTEDQHEQVARSFEAYLREGVTPASELRGMFARMRAWLLSVYRDIRQLNVTLTPEVTGVFDRMLATDDEIEAAQVRQGMQPMSLAPEARALLTDAQWNTYLATVTDATEEARNEVLQKLLAAHKREAKAWWKEKQSETRDEVNAEFEAAPVVRAWRVLSGRQTVDGAAVPEHLQGMRLDRAALVAMTSEQWVKDNLQRLGVYRKEGGVHPDTAAMALGFPSGDALIKALSTVRDLQARIGAEVDSRMRERYPDPLTDGSLPERAMDAVHNVKRVAALEQEMGLIATLAKQPAPPARLVREYARRKIAGLTLRGIRPNDYLVAERKAARETAKAAAQGDYAEALQHKRAQALNVALYAEARAAQDRAASQIAALKKLASDTGRERVGKAGKSYLDALDAVLEGHELRTASGAEVRRRDALRAWAEAQQDDGGDTILAPELLARVESERVVNVRDLTVQQLTDLHETAMNIAHLARLKDTLLKGKDKREWADAKNDLVTGMRAVLDEGKPPPLSSADLSLLERAGQGYGQFMDWMLRPETVVEWLDGGESGPWHDYFWAPMEAGEQARNVLRRQVAEPLSKLLTDLPAAERKALDEIVHVPEIGRSVSRNTILSALLNMGTASSRDKLLRGGMMIDGELVPFHPEQMAAMLRRLSPRQAELAQQVWDALDTLWPHIQAQQEALSGFAPDKLDALPVTFIASDGTQVALRGGYYPAAYDPRAGHAGSQQDDGDKLLGANFTRATTAKGYTKERTQYAAPMLLDFHAVLSRHLNQVITDLAYRQPLRQMLRVLADPTIKGIVHQRLSPSAWSVLDGSVKATIRGTGGMVEPSAAFFEKVKSGVIRNTVVAALGFKVGLMVANTVTAPLLATARVSPKFVVSGLAQYYRHPAKMTALVHELSPFMLDRATHTGQGYEDILAELRGKHGIRHRIAEASLAMHHWINPLVERGLWLGRYLEAQQQEGASVGEAVRLADKTIRQTQTQGAPKDLSAVERDPRYKLFNLFLGPMVIANNRLQDAGLRGKLHGAVQTPAVALGTWFAMTVANGALFDLLCGRTPDDRDKDGLDWADWSIWMARKAALFPFQTLPFLRNAANLFDGSKSARPDPLTEAMGVMVKFGKSVGAHALDAWSGDHDAQVQLTKDTARAAGVAIGVPSTQAVITGGNLYDAATSAQPVTSPLDARFLVYKRHP